MRVLIIKISSLGDIIHTLPALTDAGNNNLNVTFDWVVEPAFAEIPGFHRLVKKIIPVSLRRDQDRIFDRDQQSREKHRHFAPHLRPKQ